MVTRVVNLRLEKLGRVGQAKIFKWTGPGRSGQDFQVDWAGPFRPKFSSGLGRSGPFFANIQVTLSNFFSGIQMPLIGHLSGHSYISKDKVLRNFLSFVTQKLFNKNYQSLLV